MSELAGDRRNEMSVSEFVEGRYVPSIPLPLYVRHWFRWRSSCCDTTFKTEAGYRDHWRATHAPLCNHCADEFHGDCHGYATGRCSCTCPDAKAGRRRKQGE